MTTQPDEPTNKADHFARYADARAELDAAIGVVTTGGTASVSTNVRAPDLECVHCSAGLVEERDLSLFPLGFCCSECERTNHGCHTEEPTPMPARPLTLAQFLSDRLDEDEASAREATVDGHNWLVEEESIGLIPDDLDSGYLIFPRKAHAHHASTFDPARVLAEVESKRAILALHETTVEGWSDEQLVGELGARVRYADRGIYPPRQEHCLCQMEIRDGGNGPYGVTYNGTEPCQTKRLLALPYAGHPDFREEWKP